MLGSFSAFACLCFFVGPSELKLRQLSALQPTLWLKMGLHLSFLSFMQYKRLIKRPDHTFWCCTFHEYAS